MKPYRENVLASAGTCDDIAAALPILVIDRIVQGANEGGEGKKQCTEQ